MKHLAAAHIAVVHHITFLACGVLDCGQGQVTSSTIGKDIVSVCQFIAFGILIMGMHRAWKEHRNGSGMKAISHGVVSIVIATALFTLPTFMTSSSGLGNQIINFVFNNIF